MKKRTVIFLAALMAVCGIFSGCARETSSEKLVSTQPETESSSSKKSTKLKNDSGVKLPDDFRLAMESQLEELPDADGLVNTVDVALEEIGEKNVVSTAYGNFKGAGVPMIDVYIVTDLKKLIISTMYLHENWDIVVIKDVESGEYISTKKEAEATAPPAEPTEVPASPPAEAGENLSAVTRNISELEINGEKIIDITTRDMKKYDYIKDVYISVDESGNEVNITVQVPSATPTDTAKMAGEDVARYLAAMAGSANNYFKLPGSDDLGGIYDKYSLLIYIDDGNGNISLYGAKVKTANKITWK